MNKEQMLKNSQEIVMKLVKEDFKNIFPRYSFIFLPTTMATILASIHIFQPIIAEVLENILKTQIRDELPEYIEFLERNKEKIKEVDFKSEEFLEDCKTFMNSMTIMEGYEVKMYQTQDGKVLVITK